VGGSGAVLAVAGVVDDQRAGIVRGGGRVLAQQPYPLLVDYLMVPSRFREEPLQPLDLTVLRTHHRLGAGQPGQGLVAIPWQQQALQVVAETAALRQAPKQRIKPGSVVLQRAGGRRARTSGGHRWRSSWQRTGPMDRTAGAYTNLNKLPLGVATNVVRAALAAASTEAGW
jgi:hypothetical protein